jgi:hypothetical protein
MAMLSDWVSGGDLAGVVSSLAASGFLGTAAFYLYRYLYRRLELRSRERMHARNLEACESAAARGVSLVFWPDGGLWAVMADPAHYQPLEQLMANVAVTADTSTRAGSESSEGSPRSPLRSA